MTSTEDIDDGTWDLVRTVWHNGSVLSALREEPRRQVDLVDSLDRSRRSISRALNNLEDIHLVEQRDVKWCLTIAGNSAVEIFEMHADTWSTLSDSAALLQKLPDGTPIGCEMMSEMDVIAGLESAPQAAFGPVEESIRNSNRIRGFSPIVAGRYVSVLYDEIVNKQTRVELVLPKDVIFATLDQYGIEWAGSLSAANCEIWRMGARPDFGLMICDDEVYVGIYENGGLAGTLHNDTEEALEWAEMIFGCTRARGIKVLPPTDV